MNINEVIKYPLLSEKTYKQMANKIYTFAVDPRTNRQEVKNVVEFIFNVEVKKVNIINIDKQPKKMGRFEGFTNKVKKAIVYLSKGEINIFPEESSASIEKNDSMKKDSPKDSPNNSIVKKEMSEIEKKAAAKIANKIKNQKMNESKSQDKKEKLDTTKKSSLSQNTNNTNINKKDINLSNDQSQETIIKKVKDPKNDLKGKESKLEQEIKKETSDKSSTHK